jgi:hypothetical protein
VQDIRNVILSLDEVLSAFRCYQRVIPDFLPKGDIVDCRTTKDGVVLSVEMTHGTTRECSDLTLTGIDVLRPMIRFCIENNIMLPRQGRKSILIESDKIILHIELDLNTEMPASLNPLHASHVDKMTDHRPGATA